MSKYPTKETYNELQQAYDFFNKTLFELKLPPCLITLQRQKSTYGYFSGKRFVNSDGKKTDEIAMNPSFFAIRSIPETLSTLAHEQCHLWQEHYGKPGRGRYHNLEWAEKMESLGLMPSSTGQEGGKRTGDHMSHYIISGGAFDLACNELLTQEFTLSWLDRFPPYQPDSIKPFSSRVDSEDGELVDDLVELGIEFPSKPKNKSNRAKYSCPDCSAKVWGKSGLMISCGMCQIHFEEEVNL